MEIMNVITTASTGSVDLDKDVVYIREQIAAGRKSSHEVARTLLKIRNEELYTVKCATFSDFCEQYFGINKATGSKLVKVAERFLGDSTYEEYQISQLMEIRNATDEQLAKITPLMTIKQIRDVMHPNKKAIADKSADDSCDTATEDNKFEKTITEPKFDKNISEDENTPSTITGEDWTIILKDKSWEKAEITSMRGLINFTDFLRTQLHTETIDKATMKKVTIKF